MTSSQPPHASTPAGGHADHEALDPDSAASAAQPGPERERANPDESSAAGPNKKPHRRCKRIATGAALVFALPLTALVAGGAYVGFELATNRPDESPEHEASKGEYLAAIETSAAASSEARPNVVLVYYDDLGYGDFGFSGGGPIETPHIDALAESGAVLTNYHAPSPVCTPSRAAMLTGRLAPRAAVPNVLFPTGSVQGALQNKVAGDFGITGAELTIPEVLSSVGYQTSMIGKWHIGDTDGSLPRDFGFDHFLGSLYSNDINPFEIYENEDVIVEAPVDQTTIDELYTDAAVDFIDSAAQEDDPFFLYFAHNFPHDPLYVSQENEGRSDAGLYGDVVETLDDGIGRIVEELDASGELDNTIFMITSDNGPWYLGDPGDHRGRKGQVSEGGTRVPFAISWPDGIESGQTIDAMAMGTDILPTLMDVLDVDAPQDRMLDGASMVPLLTGSDDSVSDYYYFYAGEKLFAVSDGRYKYYIEQPYIHANSGLPVGVGTPAGPWLFDLEVDAAEAYDVSASHPDVVATLQAELERRNAEMADNPRGWL